VVPSTVCCVGARWAISHGFACFHCSKGSRLAKMAKYVRIRNNRAQHLPIFHNVGIFCGICVGYCGIYVGILSRSSTRTVCPPYSKCSHVARLSLDVLGCIPAASTGSIVCTTSQTKQAISSDAVMSGTPVCPTAHPCCLTAPHLASTFRQTNYPQGGKL